MPQCLNSINLYGHRLIHCLSLVEYKCIEVRLEMEESRGTVIQAAAPCLETGKKWTVEKVVQEAKSALHHGSIVDQVQQGKSSLEHGEKQPCWNKASAQEWRTLVVAEVCRLEESRICVKAVSQAKQGSGWHGRVWKNSRSAWRSCGRWSLGGWVSSLEQTPMSFRPPKILSNGCGKIHHAPCVQQQLHLDTSSLGVK